MNSLKPPSMPPELWEALSKKPAEERDRIVRVWQMLGYVEEETPAVPDTETALADIGRALGDTEKRPHLAPDRPPRSATHRPFRRFAGVGLFIVLALFGTVWYWNVPVRIVSPAGQQIKVTLPDGSTVELNSGSGIEYERGFESLPLIDRPIRHVALRGEAFFSIEPADRPFVIESFNARVQVIGTAFNVRAHPDARFPETAVTLSQGIVSVSARQRASLETKLTREGETVRIVDSGEKTSLERRQSQELSHVLAWRRQGFAVENVPLIDTVAEIERRYAISVQLDTTIVPTEPMTILFSEQPTAEEILQSICLAISCNYRQTSGGFAIF